MVITPATDAQQLGITFQWPSQSDHLAKQADAFLISALQHGCADGLTDALQGLGWATSHVSANVTQYQAFWLVRVRILVPTQLHSEKCLHDCVVVLWGSECSMPCQFCTWFRHNGACFLFPVDPSAMVVGGIHFE